MLAVYTLLVLVGYAVGRLHTDALYWMHARGRRPLPAASARSLARAARRNRADLRHVLPVLPAREVGVRMVDARNYDPFAEERTR